jgi:pyridoxal phosphate enzyme (YggS family)
MPFADLPTRLSEIRHRIDAAVKRGGHSQDVTIVAVTKTHGPDAVQAAFNAGVKDIGENKVQEALSKQPLVSSPVSWHLIGHLQRNKVKALEHFELFHALDSSRLADAINASPRPSGKPTRVLCQVNILGEETKGGHSLEELESEAERLRGLAGLSVVGAMTMAPYEASETTLRKCFAGARKAREILNSAGHPATEVSMGMSGDYEIAVEEGATLVRLGTILFGART